MNYFFLNANPEGLLEWSLKNNRWSMYYRQMEQRNAIARWEDAKEIKEGDVVFLYKKGTIQAYGYVKKITDKKYKTQYKAPLKNPPETNGIILDSVFIVDVELPFDETWNEQLLVDRWRVPKDKSSHNIILTVGKVIKLLDKHDVEIMKYCLEKEENSMEFYKTLVESQNNIILNGPPGTGKTHLAKKIAAHIVGGKSYENLNKDQKEQIKFVQFHPSYDYTDFIEGLRPVYSGKEIKFERRDGILKEFCNKIVKRNIEFLIYKNIKNKINEYSTNDDIELTIPSFKEELSGYHNLKKYLSNSCDQLTSFKFKSNNLYENYEHHVLIHLDYFFSEKQLKPQVIKLINYFVNKDKSKEIQIDNFINDKNYLSIYIRFIYKLVNEVITEDLISKTDDLDDLEKYILIIDEINRGDLQKIFGELFFSIESGYRGIKGQVTTQFQNLINNKQDPFYNGFFIPKNLYIIGTMNDIDRSIESLDFAIRRRFSFININVLKIPENEIISECCIADSQLNILSEINDNELKGKVEKKFLSLNKKIMEDLGEDYLIGAAYFLKINDYSSNKFNRLWTYNIEPLLKEYLRGRPDSEKILKDFLSSFFGS